MRASWVKSVFCISGLGRLDDCAALIVADALNAKDTMLGYPALIPKLSGQCGHGLRPVSRGGVGSEGCFHGPQAFPDGGGSKRDHLRLGSRQDNHESAEIAPRSLAAVISEIGKSATGRARREQ
jgi:hypothetical protein